MKKWKEKKRAEQDLLFLCEEFIITRELKKRVPRLKFPFMN